MSTTTAKRDMFSRRSVFIFAAIGSAVGLGNIWRFPYTAFNNGGGAFLIPYLVALLTAGLPILYFEYAMGHKYRGSAPLSFRRFRSWSEPIGWFQTGIAFIIGIYYAVIVAWSLLYMWFSVKKSWEGPDGEPNAGAFFESDFLHQSSDVTIGLDFVGKIVLALAVIWLICIVVLALGVQKGIGRTAVIFIPLLVVIFTVLVIRSLTLDGAVDGLNAFFTPDWGALANTNVWLAAYAQIFFSLSIGFGVMITYSSYLKRKSDLTGSGTVVAFSNSAFEILAGIGVFATLGFLASSSGKGIDEVAGGGIGLAFVTFPTIISQMAGGSIFGVLFFLCLVLAGLTSLISIIEVVIAAIREKLGIGRLPAVLGVGGVMATISLLLFPTTTGIFALDIMDRFANNIGVAAAAVVSAVVVDWIRRQADPLAAHLNTTSTVKVGTIWRISAFNLIPAVLLILVGTEVADRIQDGYEGYPTAMVNALGWGMLGIVLLVALLLSVTPWKKGTRLDGAPDDGFLPADHEPASAAPSQNA